jgi:nucleotide-binding universal stress UspA family protein
MTQKTILAAVGRLPQDIAVLKRAIEVAATSGAELQVIHVLDLPGHAGELEDVTSFLGQIAFAARDSIKLALTELGADPREVRIQIVLGPHAIALINICKDLSPDLIVMRAHHKLKLKDKILGSTTDRVIAAAETPVLVVKRAAKSPYAGIVLATNGTDGALEMSRFVTALLPAARLTLVQAVQIPPQLKEAMLRVGSRQGELKTLRMKLVGEAEDHLRTITAPTGLNLKSRVLKGDPAKVLRQICSDKDVDLMVLGQGRASLVRRAFIGSVSRRLLRDARCDVLIWSPTAT